MSVSSGSFIPKDYDHTISPSENNPILRSANRIVIVDKDHTKVTEIFAHAISQASLSDKIQFKLHKYVLVEIPNNPVMVKLDELSRALGIAHQDLEKLSSKHIFSLIKLHSKIHQSKIEKTKREEVIEALFEKHIINAQQKDNLEKSLEKDPNALKSFTHLAYVLDKGKIEKLAKIFADPVKRTKIFKTLISLGHELADYSKADYAGKLSFFKPGEDERFSYMISKDGKNIYIKNESEVLGRGGQKTVYSAVGLKSDEELVWSSGMSMTQMKKEADLLALLHEIGVTDLMPAYKEADKHEDYEMVQTRGIPGDAYFKKGSVDQNISMLQDVSRGLSSLHQKTNFVFMDMKPENILIINNKAHIHDFGALTQQNKLIAEASITYAPPELFKVGQENYKAAQSYDSFSLGVTIFQTLTKKSLFLRDGKIISFGQFKNQAEMDKAIEQEVRKLDFSSEERQKAIENKKSKLAKCEKDLMSLEASLASISSKEKSNVIAQINELQVFIKYYKDEVNNLENVLTEKDKEATKQVLEQVCKGLIVFNAIEDDSEPKKSALNDLNRERQTCQWAHQQLEKIQSLTILE